MWPAQQTNAVHDPTTLYRTFTAGSAARAAARSSGRRDRHDPVLRQPARRLRVGEHDDADRHRENVRTIVHDSLGAEVVAYFGCWLDINQPTDMRFPGRLLGTTPANLPDGPFTGTGQLLSIQQLVRSLHQCLIVELDLDGQTIPQLG